MKNSLFLILSLILCSNITRAQSIESSEKSKLNLYSDIGAGYFSFATVNLESHISGIYSEKVNWYGRVGFGVGGTAFVKSGIGGLGALTLLTGKGKHHFEVSGGVFLGSDSNSSFTLPVLELGYRYQKPEGGFLLRGKVGILNIGIGIGYSF